ncbi:MAG TPA: hypothetical protein VHF07_01340 [Nitrospiraceae bacterium]|nr:hypothetical protein [Nitrospiraceae bacterium]
MALIPSQSIVETLSAVRAALKHAFAIPPENDDWSPEERALLDRVAEAVVKRGMAAPATVFLESMGPMNFLGSQAMHFMSPILECAFSAKEVSQVACLLERRDTLPRLILLIDAKSVASQGPPVR